MKQLGLEPERDLADLVEEDRPAPRKLELAGLHLGFEKVFGQAAQFTSRKG